VWEVLQFEQATLVSPGVYEISRLLRAQAGSEAAMAGPLPAGATFALLDSASTRISLTLDEVGLATNWRYGPVSRDIGDISYGSRVHAYQGVGMKPLSPVHLRGTRNGGDLAISWVRRTRRGGDGWEAAEVPLAESEERYEVDILDGATSKRTIVTGAPYAVYTAADQIADFGALQAAVLVRVQQTSAVRGRGTPRTALL
jgi:hypothetical protein